jgi:terminase, large subunit
MSQPQLIAREIPLHPALPEEMRHRLAGRSVSLPLPRPVRMRLRQPEKITVSECAAKYRRVTGIDARPGPWRNDLVPHTVFPMDLFRRPWVKEIWLCWPERTAKTNVMLNCLSAVAKCFPGNVFWLEPTEPDAGNNVKTKIIPMFRESPALRKYLSPRADDTGKKLIAFAHGMHLFPASANSASSMANFFGKYNFGNEVDKYPAMVGTETDPIKLIRKRGRDVRGSKYMFGSTPAGRYIYKGTMSCRQVWQYRNRCPHCGELVLMDDEHLDIPTGATAEEVENGDVAVGYACNSCGTVWNEYDRELSYLRGDWHCVKGADDPRPGTVGLHASALPFPMIPLSEYAGKYLRSKSGDLADKVDYAHGYKVEDYTADKQERKEEFIERLCDDRPEGLVPSEPISAISCVADMQKRGFWYTIRAWGYGLEQESWLLKCGFVDTWEGLRRVMFESQFEDVAKNKYVVTLRGLDSGGGEGEEHADLSRTAEAYLFAAANPGVVLFKGRRRMAREYNVTAIDRIPGTNKALPGSAKLYTINTTFFKDKLAGKLQVNPSDPGAWHVHSGYTCDQLALLVKGEKVAGVLKDFFSQMVAEFRNDQGHYECPKNKANHLWDCSQMEQALVEIVQLNKWPKPEQQVHTGRRVRSQGIQ